MTESSDNVNDDRWYEAAFGKRYMDVYKRRDASAAKTEVAFAIEKLGLKAGQRVLDVCCGPGYHMAAMRETGIEAVGVDLSKDLIRQAYSLGPASRCDMRSIPYAGPFDAVTAFFTSVGYFDDAENAMAISEMGRLVAMGGGIFIDYLNPQRVRKTLKPLTTRTVEGHRIREERWLDDVLKRVNKKVTLESPDGEILEYTESVRLYETDEMTALLNDAGFDAVDIFGSFNSEPYSTDSARMILTGKKVRAEKQLKWKGAGMMFQQIDVGGDRNFAYLIADGDEAAAVDPTHPGRVRQAAKEAGVTIKYIVNTHSHADHTAGNDALKRSSDAQIIAHQSAAVNQDISVKGGETFELGGSSFEILATPGHTSDCICILFDGRLITGDTLFVGKVGGTDLGEGARLEFNSLHEVIGKLPDETEVWPGHDYGVTPSSTVGHEKKTNPFFMQPTFEDFVDLKQNWVSYKRKHGIK